MTTFRARLGGVALPCVGLGVYLASVLMVHSAAFAPFDLVVAAAHGVQEGKVAACLLVALAAGLRPVGRPFMRGTVGVACACSLLAVACSYGPLRVAASLPGLAPAFAFVEGVGGALATLLFLVALCSRGSRAALAGIPLAIALSHVLFALASALPQAVGTWAKPVYLACSLGLLLACWFGRSHSGSAGDAPAGRLAGACPPASASGARVVAPSSPSSRPAAPVASLVPRSTALAVAGCVALPFVYVLVSRMVIADIYATDLYGLAQEVVLVVIMLGIAAYALVSKRGEREADIELAIITCDVAFATALLLLALFGPGTLGLVGALVQGGFFVFNALLWMFVAHEVSGDVRRAAALFGVVDGTLYLFAMAGRVVGVHLRSQGDALSTALFLGIWLLAMLLLALFLVERRRAAAAAASAVRPEGDVLAASCEALSRARGLSEREAQVMLAFARGRSAARIAEELGISQETVKTHVKHVYAKVGVHSRQELLDALELEQAQGAE